MIEKLYAVLVDDNGETIFAFRDAESGNLMQCASSWKNTMKKILKWAQSEYPDKSLKLAEFTRNKENDVK